MAITVQSTYVTDYPAGQPGNVVNGEASNRISRTVEDAAGLPFGKAAFRGSSDHGVVLAPAAGAFMGIVIADVGVAPTTAALADIMPQYSTAGLLNEGVIYVSASVAVADGDAAYVTSAGLITNVSTSNTAIPAVFDATTSAAGVVPLRVRRS